MFNPYTQQFTGNPWGYQPQTVQQPQYTQQQAQSQQSNMDWLMVADVKSVESVSVQPGQKAWVMAQNEPVFALKTANQLGLVTTEYYKFERYDPNTQPTAAVIQPGDYVTRKEFEEYTQRIRMLLTREDDE